MELETKPVDPTEKEETRDPELLVKERFRLVYPKFLERVSGASNKQLRRVFCGLLSLAFLPNKPRFTTKQEQELFELGLNLLDANGIMFMISLHKQEQEKNKQGEENGSTETKK